jgi:hypothetical protein
VAESVRSSRSWKFSHVLMTGKKREFSESFHSIHSYLNLGQNTLVSTIMAISTIQRDAIMVKLRTATFILSSTAAAVLIRFGWMCGQGMVDICSGLQLTTSSFFSHKLKLASLITPSHVGQPVLLTSPLMRHLTLTKDFNQRS